MARTNLDAIRIDKTYVVTYAHNKQQIKLPHKPAAISRGPDVCLGQDTELWFQHDEKSPLLMRLDHKSAAFSEVQFHSDPRFVVC